jgi:hypothetical protein
MIRQAAFRKLGVRLPLWVKSRHDAVKRRCPLYPQKRTSVGVMAMSALGQIRKIALAKMQPRYLMRSPGR